MTKYNFDKRELIEEATRRVRELFDFCVANDLPLIVEVCTYHHEDGENTGTLSSSARHGTIGSMSPTMQGYMLFAQQDTEVQFQAVPLVLRLMEGFAKAHKAAGN